MMEIETHIKVTKKNCMQKLYAELLPNMGSLTFPFENLFFPSKWKKILKQLSYAINADIKV